MRIRAVWLQVAVLSACVSALGCQRLPGGNWHIETGSARLTDDAGQRRPRMNAVALARRNAELKLLDYVEAMTMPGSTFVGDFMVQNPTVGARVRSLLLSARQFGARYVRDESVEVDLGVNLDEVRRTVGEAKP